MLKISRIKKDELIKGGFILLITIGIFNILNYIFQMSMAKILGPADYGVLAVLMSFIYIMTIPSEAIQTVISRYISKFSIKKEYGKMKYLMNKSLKKGLFIAVIAFLIYIPIAYIFSLYLKINVSLIIFSGLYIFYVFSISIIRGILQGRKEFFRLGTTLVIESFIKLISGVFLVILGLKVYGAVGGVLLGGFLALIFAFNSIKKIIKSGEKSSNFSNPYLGNLPAITAVSSIVLMYSVDVIMAKFLFPAVIVGQYAFVSLIGKTILFSSLAVGRAMFPLSSENHNKGKPTIHLYKKSIVIVFLISIIALTAFLLAPKEIIKILSLGSEDYLGASNILFIMGLAFSFMSFSNIIIMYNLSTYKTKKSALYYTGFIFLEIILLAIFHANLIEFSLATLSVSIIMFLYSLFLVKR